MKKECVIDSLPAEHRQVFVEVLVAKDPYLLAALRSARTLTQDDIEEVETLFAVRASTT